MPSTAGGPNVAPSRRAEARSRGLGSMSKGSARGSGCLLSAWRRPRREAIKASRVMWLAGTRRRIDWPRRRSEGPRRCREGALRSSSAIRRGLLRHAAGMAFFFSSVQKSGGESEPKTLAPQPPSDVTHVHQSVDTLTLTRKCLGTFIRRVLASGFISVSIFLYFLRRHVRYLIPPLEGDSHSSL